ncbi:peptidase [Streptomyces sp. NPDC127166]|uniref:peptidase n=1 Tax=Streptomyces sp. NPDC127166 TaxID=3345380 RepID=UPI0036288150
MKIRRILATAVAAAVTTPVVFLSAAPAFADTKPSPTSTQKPASHEDDPDEDMPSIEELKAAVAAAQKAYDEAVVELDKAMADLKALDKDDHPLRVAVTEAKKAADEAAAKKTAADEALAKAKQDEQAVKDRPDATDQEKADAAAAVAAAQTAADEAATAKTAADDKLAKADTAFDDARVAASRVIGLAQKVKKAAEEDLDDAKEELAFYEDMGEECTEDGSVKVALTGPKTVTAGKSASFSLRVSNDGDRDLDAVSAYVNALQLPEPGDVIDEETDFSERYISVEWSSADNPEWTKVTKEFDSIEVGKLVKGGQADVKLRLTVKADAPAGKGSTFAFGAYENNDGSCGMSEDYATLQFDILAADKGDKPKPTDTPSPAPTVTTGGNTNTTQQGGRSNTPVNGTLAATGANDTLPVGLAAVGAVALGAGALVVARRRKAGAQA